MNVKQKDDSKQEEKLIAIKHNIKSIISFLVLNENRQIENSRNDIVQLSLAMENLEDKVCELFKKVEQHEVFSIFFRILWKNIERLSLEEKLPIVIYKLFRGDQIEFLSEELIDFLNKLPLTYKINFSIPLFQGCFKIEEDIISCRFPAEGKLKKNIIEEIGYYSIDKEGLSFLLEGLFANNHSVIYQKALSVLKFVVQRGLSNGIYIRKKSIEKVKIGLFANLPATQTHIDKYSVSMKEINDSDCIFSYKSIQLTDGVCYFLSKLQVDTGDEKLSEEKISLFFNEKLFLIKESLNEELLIKTLTKKESAKHDSPALNIIAASNWCFDSYAIEEESITQAFLNVCFGLEALFNERKEEGKEGFSVTNNLAIKCGYLISDSLSERNQVKKDVRRIYDIRSKIVHGEKLFLSGNDIGYLEKARDFLERSINREIGLFRKFV